MNNLINKRIYCLPGEKLSPDVIKQLVAAKASTKKDFPKYMRAIGKIFSIKEAQTTIESNLFLAGFIEGEASMNVSAKKLKTARFGLMLDPEFSITQHVNGVENLYLAMSLFKTGRISYKSGSNATLVFVIDNRQSIEEKVLPFFKKYVDPYGSTFKKQRVESFKKVLTLLKDNAHRDLDRLVYELLPEWNTLRMQKGQINESFKSLKDAQEYVQTFRKLG
jgi:LAGLIDADG endonuclease